MTQAVASSGELALRPSSPDDPATSPNSEPSPRELLERVPVRAAGLEPLGEFAGSGHRRPPSLVRRADGQTVQLTPLLYALLGEIDGDRTYRELAPVVGERIGKVVAPQHVRFLVEKKLAPLGLVGTPDGSEPVLRRANPLLALRPRFVVTNQRVTRWIATPFAIMFFPPVVVAFVAAFLATNGWLYFERGLAPAVRHALYEPSLLLMVFALTLLSAGFHELGHAAACRYGGGKPGAMGVGLYLIWPAFYTDVTDAYRLDRRGRLRVDLGGVYFNAVFAVGAFGLWAATGWEALLVVIPLQLFAMARQLLPLVRLDGYHVLADLTGVPDLFAHVKPILAGMLPWRWGTPASKQLRPSVRAIVTAWVLMVVPLLAFMFVTIVVTLPRLAATAWDSAGIRWNDATASWTGGEPAAAAVSFLSMLAIAIPILSMSYLVVRISRRTIRRVWRATDGRPVMRGVAALVAASMLAMVATAWWPDGQYRPLQSTDRGAVDVRFRDSLLYERVLGWMSTEAQRAPTSLPASGMESSEATAGTDATRTEARSEGGTDLTSGTDSAPFRFTEPDPPREGDNQALAVNYEDGSSIYDVALSLIFDSDDLVDGVNEAWALASCTDCSTVAVAFQVLLMLDNADVVIPQNIAVAVNVLCTECLTYALAMQTIVTLDQPLSQKAEAELSAVWRILEEIMDNIEDIPLEDLYPTLLAIQQQIIAIVEAELAAGAVIDGGTVEAIVLPSGSPSPSDASDLVVDDEGSTETTSEPSPTAEPTEEPSPEPTEEPSPEPTEEPSPEPTP